MLETERERADKEKVENEKSEESIKGGGREGMRYGKRWVEDKEERKKKEREGGRKGQEKKKREGISEIKKANKGLYCLIIKKLPNP